MVLNLLSETLILSIGMALLCALPLVSARVRAHSRVFFLLGTGAMFGICFFDLLPDVFELGGRSSLLVAGGVWALYSIFHVAKFGADGHGHGHDGHHHHHDAEAHASYLFLASMIGHCVASGMLLAASESLSARLASSVFIALIAHKGYESLTVSSVLLRKILTLKGRIAAISAYALSLPFGVVVTVFFREQMNQKIAVTISSVAIGTLLGCLIFDFLIPSVVELRSRKARAGWLLLGFALTQFVMRGL